MKRQRSRKRYPWGDAEVSACVTLYEKGVIIHEIADAINNEFHHGEPARNTHDIQYAMQKARKKKSIVIRQPKNHWSDEELSHFYDLYAKNVLTYPQIAEALNEKFHNGEKIRNRKSFTKALDLVFERGLDTLVLREKEKKYVSKK